LPPKVVEAIEVTLKVPTARVSEKSVVSAKTTDTFLL